MPEPPPHRAELLEEPSAALWRRAAARAREAATVFFALWMLAVLQLLWFVGELADRFHPEPWGRALVPALAFSVAWVVYEAVFLRYNDGQTPGKDVLGVRVVRRADGGDPTLLRAAMRWLLPGGAAAMSWPILDWPVATAAVAAATGATALVGPQRRAVHDRLAGTIVVRYRHRADDDEDDDEDVNGYDLDDGSPDGSTVVSELIFGRLRRRPPRQPPHGHRRTAPRRRDASGSSPARRRAGVRPEPSCGTVG